MPTVVLILAWILHCHRVLMTLAVLVQKTLYSTASTTSLLAGAPTLRTLVSAVALEVSRSFVELWSWVCMKCCRIYLLCCKCLCAVNHCSFIPWVPKLALFTVPQIPNQHNSKRPSLATEPPTKRTSPWVHSAAAKSGTIISYNDLHAHTTFTTQ